jgi:hypothetical protein
MLQHVLALANSWVLVYRPSLFLLISWLWNIRAWLRYVQYVNVPTCYVAATHAYRLVGNFW